MKKYIVPSLLVLLLFGPASLLAQKPDCGLLSGWTQKGAARFHEPDNLFDYMNGNSEGYLIYHFVQLHGVTCQNSLGDTIVMDVYEMEDPDFAFGIFMSIRDARQPLTPMGTRAQITQRRGLLAKDKYYIEISANPAKDHSESLKGYLTALDKQIAGRTTPPEALGWFPQEKLVPDSVRMVPQSVLGIGLLKTGYAGQYEFGKGFLVIEQTPESATKVMEKLKARVESIQPVEAGEEAFTGTDKYLDGIYVFRRGRLLGGFAGIKGGLDVRKELAAFASTVKP